MPVLVVVGMGDLVVETRQVFHGLGGVEHIVGGRVGHVTNTSVSNWTSEPWWRIWNIAGFRWDVVELRNWRDLGWTACGGTRSCSSIVLYFIT